MSWAEIKKALNSDISTPLNEFIKATNGDIIFEDVINSHILTGSISNGTTEQTVLNISGKGKLTDVLAQFQSGTASTGAGTINNYLKIIIDGVLVGHYNILSGYTSNVGMSSYGGLISKPPIAYALYNQSHPNVLVTTLGIGVQGLGTLALPLSSTAQQVTMSGYDKAVIGTLIESGVPFKTSCKVTMQKGTRGSSDNNDKYWIRYVLE